MGKNFDLLLHKDIAFKLIKDLSLLIKFYILFIFFHTFVELQ